MASGGARLAFVAEYFDPQANIVRQYQLCFYTEDNSLEMYDMRNKRLFLKRCPYPSLTLKELFVGSSVTVHSRVLRLVDFGDQSTRKALANKIDELILFVYGEALYQCGNIAKIASGADVRMANIRLVQLDDRVAARLRVPPRGVAMHVVGSDLDTKLRTLQQSHGTSTVAFHGGEEMELLRQAFHGRCDTATYANCAVCVIKPHAIGVGQAGGILQRLLDEGFEISALGMFALTTADAEDFLEVYKGVVPEYRKLVEHFASAPCWAIEVRAENAVPALRAVCGPHDPDVSSVLYPQTIRAAYGLDRTLNAVHCTDLVEDGPLESEFFFSLMASK